MTAARPISRHPSAGYLLRRLDGELDARTEVRLTRHLEKCESCRGRMAEMADHSRAASRYLRALPPGVPVGSERRGMAKDLVRQARFRRSAQVRRRRGWAVAAAIAGLLLVSISVDPLRAWVLQRLAINLGDSDASAPLALPSTVVDGEGSVIAFEPSEALFTVQVERVQPAGELLLQVLPVDRATAQITRPAGETMLVLPSGLRIENVAASRASYRVTLPETVERVIVRVGDSAPRILEVPADGEWRARVPLGR